MVANGQDQWWEPEVGFDGLDRPRYIRAAEFKPSYPGGIKVAHHGHAVLRGREAEEGEERPPSVRLVGMGIGKRWDLLPDGVGKLLPPGPATVRFNLHYLPMGEEVTDVIDVGVWLYPEGEEPDKVTAGERQFYVDGTHRERLRASDILIPPHGSLVLEDQYVMDQPALVQSFRPHMHMRGTEMSMTALYPDGRRELLSNVNRYDHNWQIAYIYDDDAQPLLPKGTVLMLRAKWDNSAANRITPTPTSGWCSAPAASTRCRTPGSASPISTTRNTRRSPRPERRAVRPTTARARRWYSSTLSDRRLPGCLRHQVLVRRA